MTHPEKTYPEPPSRADSAWDNVGIRNLDGRVSSSYPQQPKAPLINYVTNAWMASVPKYSKSGTNMKADCPSKWPARTSDLRKLATAPRFRRYIIVYFILLWICLGSWLGFFCPRLKENSQLLDSLSLMTKGKMGGWFGSNSMPKFNDLVYIRSLDPTLLPSDGKTTPDNPHRKRLIVLGDVHGCLDELENLLRKVAFDPKQGDHLIFTGDLIAKGPKSIGVVDLARKYRSSCVRGNNEDRTLLARRNIKGVSSNRKSRSMSNNELDKASEDVTSSKNSALAAELSDEQAEWLDTCPVILKVGSIKGMDDVVVVHGGLVPGLELEKQDPTAVMSMRTIDLLSHAPSSSSDGVPWTKLFNKYQTILARAQNLAPPEESLRYARPTTVLYGHQPHSSPLLKKYTKGLDTNCVRGGKLSAMIIEDGGITSIQSVRCKNYMTKMNRLTDCINRFLKLL
ncbi:uncharacterized protein PADG_07331 [Paracoccidioides brasiliensis Pb18]|uniref:Calcineurin-like phosphoesterase domain-containing protein n=1 Tax=Paracoccidioides brasiliensis (strain Pb18) TaxID=502780 RepID=C1GJ95_PARBD|nr:uncharacterized protein PADG_07331 [Paracoccidioides brasiliensis Pb18]EEH42511.1 hypothetical protein PADG_07331 [Paracoccidioides brasiliensis Pb18]